MSVRILGFYYHGTVRIEGVKYYPSICLLVITLDCDLNVIHGELFSSVSMVYRKRNCDITSRLCMLSKLIESCDQLVLVFFSEIFAPRHLLIYKSRLQPE